MLIEEKITDSNVKSYARKLFDEVQKAYGPIHFPSKEEINEALVTLMVILKTKPDLSKVIVQRAKIVGNIHGDHKTKVTTLIANRFWEHDFGYGIQANKFIEEQ